MVSFTASPASFSAISCSLKRNQVLNLRKASLSFSWKDFSSRRAPALCFRVACAAKPETVKKVVKIVKKQLALPDDSEVSGESKFATLGADSLDSVEIVMGLEEEFGISVEEESS
ncbi:Acyl carrier protein 2- chloroplastic [Striga hermonthica]|uniref:Acyl carrier protein 2- chloroplastic n=1 Tax=Striga hermonthica TaxID=68872 RepID=A0A9N7P3M2_STRHE|nr:Acyl carrier protein 2- chloroplastic [Striga hermonthica]